MGIEERKRREKEQRLQEILNAAKGLFTEKGFDNTTMLDIAEAAELSRRTLYHYFKSKEDISLVIMLESYQTMRDLIIKAWQEEYRTGYQKMEFLRDALLEFYHEHYDEFTFTLFLDVKMDLTGIQSEETIQSSQIVDSLVSDIEAILDEGIQDGSIRKIGESRWVALTVLTMLLATMQKIYIHRNWIRRSYSVEDDKIVNTMFDIYLAAMKA